MSRHRETPDSTTWTGSLHSGWAIGSRRFDAAAIAVLFLAYSATLYVARHLDIGQALLAGLANVLPVIVFGGVARQLILHRLVGRSVLRQTLGHMGLGVAFPIFALWLLTIALGMMNDLSLVNFKVTPFPTRASAWQLLENLSIYGLIATLAYLQSWRHALEAATAATAATTIATEEAQGASPPTAEPARHFIRLGEDILPIDLDRIVCITGADDYAEVATPEQTYLVKMTLAEFSRTLDPGKFLRVHRSAIVNLQRIARAESAGGGRMLVHMTSGQTIKASRAGSQLLRTRIL